MAKTREIKKRIKAVGNIRRITKTMQMIATSKFARAQQAATATKPYTEGLFGLVTELAATVSGGEVSHPLLAGPTTVQPGARELTLVLTSDRGLAGPYNSAVLRTATTFFRNNPSAKSGLVEVVGKKGGGFFRYSGVPVAAQHPIGDKPTFEKIEKLAQGYLDRFIAGEITTVRVVYMRFISAGRQVPEILQLLPLKPDELKVSGAKHADPAASAQPAGNVLYEFSPPAEELLGDLLPATVKAVLFQCFNDAVVSEHVARMVAMKAATDNAGKMRKLLTRDYNRARQAAITTELGEIISGAAALG
ncbi:MAG: ATP synthase F1 subunit gamma [Phycisphaerales bacterium]